MKKCIAAILCCCMVFAFAGCGNSGKSSYKAIPGLDTETNVTLTIAIPYETNKALNTVSNAFMTKYPNVSVQLQYVEDYDANALELFKQNKLDLILQRDVSLQEYTVTDPATKEKTPTGTYTDDYFYNFAADTEIDFSHTTHDISDNYLHTGADRTGTEITYQYCYPLGGETRGVFVNKTLLDQYGLSIPTNWDAFYDCCEKLKQQGLVPIQGGADTAAYGLALAPAANAAVHNEAQLAAFAAGDPAAAEAFAPTMEKLYQLATSRSFDYKKVEQTGFFKTTNELGQVQSFLGLKTDENTFAVSKPENNFGTVAFLPYISSAETVLQSLIEEYGLDTEVQFILSPLNDADTHSPAYITPYYGICANKNSENLIWAREFVNFLFQPDNMKTYGEEASIIPNRTDAMQIVAERYDLNVDTDVTLCGQIRFSNTYNGYTPIANASKNVMKCSAQKYMVDLNRDASGNIQYQLDENGKEFLYMGNGETTVYREDVGEEDPTMPGYAFCKLDYYMEILRNEISTHKVG